MFVHILTVNGKPIKVFADKTEAMETYEDCGKRYDSLGYLGESQGHPYGVISMKLEPRKEEKENV